MSNRIIIAGIFWIMIFAAMVVTGCSQEKMSVQRSAAVRTSDSDVLLDGYRIRRDATRNRIWLLGLDDVRVYDGGTKRLITKIALPGWAVARFTCDPDMVLNGSGSAIISSNVQPRLWRIDADSLEVSDYTIRLQDRENWDVGFGALAMAADGTLLALTSVSESLWKIDLTSGSAQMVAPAAALSDVCGLRVRNHGKAAGGLDAFTNFVPAAGSDFEFNAAGANNIPATSRLDVTFERGRNP